MGIAENLLTADEFAQLPPDPEGCQMELVDGRVVLTPPPGGRHGYLEVTLIKAIGAFVSANNEGLVVAECGFSLTHDGRNVRAPDIAFLARERVPAAGIPDEYFVVPPTLAVEVVSPSDRADAIDEKVLAYLAAGSERVWVVRPRTRTVTVHRPGGDSHTYIAGDTLTSADAGFAMEGFSLSLLELFS